jgi:hypothetical protein
MQIQTLCRFRHYADSDITLIQTVRRFRHYADSDITQTCTLLRFRHYADLYITWFNTLRTIDITQIGHYTSLSQQQTLSIKDTVSNALLQSTSASTIYKTWERNLCETHFQYLPSRFPHHRFFYGVFIGKGPIPWWPHTGGQKPSVTDDGDGPPHGEMCIAIRCEMFSTHIVTKRYSQSVCFIHGRVV